MKKIYIILMICVVAIAASLQSCRVAPDDSQLDAQWQLLNVEYADSTPTFVPNPRAYFNLYRHVVNLNLANGVSTAGTLDHSGNQLTMRFQKADPSLGEWGIPDTMITAETDYPQCVKFDIKSISGKSMVLESVPAGATFYFRKY